MIRRVAGWLWAALSWLAPRATGRLEALVDLTDNQHDDVAIQIAADASDQDFRIWTSELKTKENS